MKRLPTSPRSGWALSLVAFLCLFFVQTKANAVPVVGLTDKDRLVFFDSDAPGAVVALVSVTGLQPGEHVLAVDFRPLTGQIYALGSASRLYILNPVTGAATQVGSGSFTPSLNGIEFGFDFDPTADQLRVVSNTGQNLRLDPNTGAVVSVDSPLAFASGQLMGPDVTGVAYTNNFAGATTSTLYAIDWRRAQLQRIGSPSGSPISPNTGQVFTVGTLATGFQITEMVGFDIAANGGTAYASLRSGDALSASLFYTVNLSTGVATQVGQIGGGEFIRDLTVIERGVELLAVTASNKLIRFHSGTPGTIISSVAVKPGSGGRPVGEIIGIDHHPVSHALQALSRDGFLYSINTDNGETFQWNSSAFAAQPNAGDFGFSFRPDDASLGKLVSSGNQNLLLFARDPAGLSTETPLAYASSDTSAGRDPNIVGAAFTLDESSTTLFDIDSDSDTLVRQGSIGGTPSSPASGQLFTIGALGVDTTGTVGFDINASPLVCPCNNGALRRGSAFASLTAPGDSVSSLYLVNLRTGAATLVGMIGGGEVINALAVVPSVGTFRFAQDVYNVGESDGRVTVTVTRTGDTNVEASVDYETRDGFGTASQPSDYIIAFGRLRFAPGEISKTFDVLITDDGISDETGSGGVVGETFFITLLSPTAGYEVTGTAHDGTFPLFNSTEVRIIDNDSAPPPTNPIDDPEFFVRQHYRDFLNRDADAAGLAFWKNEITSCGADTACVERKRINVSAAFFLSIEFQNSGFLVHRLYKASFNRLARYREFMNGTQKLGRGLVVGESGWEVKLEANKQAFLNEWVNCKAFKEVFGAKSNAEYVDALFANAGIVPTASERDSLIGGLDNHTETRASVLRRLVENQAFQQREFNQAFVLVEYFGYLRRNPDDPPDFNLEGFNFWLNKLNQFNGNYIAAEMVKAFITSSEYRQHFAP